jgi:hypothetical protein
MDEGGCKRVENDEDRFEDESIIAAQLVRKLARTEQKQAKLGVHSFLMVLAGLNSHQ